MRPLETDTLDLPTLRLMAGGALGMALANGFGLQNAGAQVPEPGPVQLPPVMVNGAQTGDFGSYHRDPFNLDRIERWRGRAWCCSAAARQAVR